MNTSLVDHHADPEVAKIDNGIKEDEGTEDTPVDCERVLSHVVNEFLCLFYNDILILIFTKNSLSNASNIAFGPHLRHVIGSFYPNPHKIKEGSQKLSNWLCLCLIAVYCG